MASFSASAFDLNAFSNAAFSFSFNPSFSANAYDTNAFAVTAFSFDGLSPSGTTPTTGTAGGGKRHKRYTFRSLRPSENTDSESAIYSALRRALHGSDKELVVSVSEPDALTAETIPATFEGIHEGMPDIESRLREFDSISAGIQAEARRKMELLAWDRLEEELIIKLLESEI